ncbi:MAG: hypothetical protein HY052_09730 [Proteobacteria bacterium]|nr:hypothetical protein [Pseudomonadota bacterium]
MDSAGASPPKNLGLPQDIEALAKLRDQLGDYLTVVERNTDSVNNWLTANKNNIILFHQKLERSLNNQDEATALALLSQMGDVAGFVLGLQDFKAKSETAFGRDNAFQKAIAPLTDMMPATLQEPLPTVVIPTVHVESAPPAAPPPPVESQDQSEEEPKEQKKGLFRNWFGGKDKEEKQPEEQKPREEPVPDVYQQLRAVKDELLGLQSARHYYIDSFMNWVADTLEPATFDANGKAADASARMLAYQNPATIIDIAHADYQEAVEGHAQAVREMALQYSRVAAAIDGQEASVILAELKNVFPATATAASELLKKVLLGDYQALSWDELILKHIKHPCAKVELLESPIAVPTDEKLVFADAKTAPEIFEKFLGLVLAKENPLAPGFLPRVMADLKSRYDTKPEDFLDTIHRHNVFQRVIERFQNDLPAQEAALSALLSGMDGQRPEISGSYVQFNDALQRKDAGKLLSALKKIETEKSAFEAISLWYLCHPDASLLTDVLSVSASPLAKASLLEQSLNAGLLDEIRIDGNYPYGYGDRKGPAYKFETLMQNEVLSALDTFPVNTVRRLIAHSFSAGGLEGLRAQLSQAPGGWLEKVVSSKISDEKKTEWVAALLEPFDSGVIKANILAQAAHNLAPGKASATLSHLEQLLVGENIRLTDDKVLCHLNRIANIWYNADSRTVNYAVAQGQGKSHVLLDNISAQDAEELLSLIERRGGFLRENHGLFRPENIDAICHGTDPRSGIETSAIFWYHVKADLHTDAATVAALKKRTDFMHVTDPDTGAVSSYNLSSICLLQALEDGSTLMIDKYGVQTVLTGEVTLKKDARLLDIDATTKFNPDNAAIIRLNQGENSFDFRIESFDFDKLLRQDEFLYTVPVQDPGALTALRKKLDKRPDMHTTHDSDLYFNMKVLGYLSLNRDLDGEGLDDKKAVGFYCKRYSSARKPGFIQVSPEMAKQVLTDIGQRPGVVHIGNLLMHEESIDDAYYNTKKEKLQFLIGSEIQEVYAPAWEKRRVLDQLAGNPQFGALSESEGNTLLDVVHADHITLLSHDPVEGSTEIITESQPFPVALNDNQAQALFNRVENEGLASAREAVLKVDGWTRSVGATVAQLPALEVRVAPFVSQESPTVLLQQALGQITAEESGPRKLKDAFTTAASLPGAYEQFRYPDRKIHRAGARKAAASSRPKPRR